MSPDSARTHGSHSQRELSQGTKQSSCLNLKITQPLGLGRRRRRAEHPACPAPAPAVSNCLRTGSVPNPPPETKSSALPPTLMEENWREPQERPKPPPTTSCPPALLPDAIPQSLVPRSRQLQHSQKQPSPHSVCATGLGPRSSHAPTLGA